jgi:hypothetical protein
MQHFEYLAKFKTKVTMSLSEQLDNSENRILFMEIAIKCGDLSNPTKTIQIASKWTACIMEEFFRQGDRERNLGLPISQFMDRESVDIPKCQVN